MSDEMILEDYPYESDEAEDWESDEFFAESDESAEDIGERARRNRNRRRRRVRGVSGVRLRGPDGVRNVPFPAKLATATETNRGLASLGGRLDRIENGVRSQHRNDSSITGIVTLILGGGLSVWGAVEASRQSGFSFGNWAKQPQSQMAALASVSQIATSGAKLAIHRRYPRAGLGIAADIFSVAQLAAFAFGSLHKPSSFRIFKKKADIVLPVLDPPGTLFLTQDQGETFLLQVDSATGTQALQLVK
jgi:hypothetical protein